jgi:hypothetical protein
MAAVQILRKIMTMMRLRPLMSITEMKSENYMRKTQEQIAEDIAVAAIARFFAI